MTEYAKEVVLPTRGLFYNGQLPDGRVTLEPMGTKEEKMLAGGRQGSVDSILDRIFHTTLKCAIPPNQLKTVDRFFLLIHLRRMSYGDEYRFAYKCEECERKVSGAVNLSDLPIQEAIDDASEPFEVELPIKGDTIQWCLLTGEAELKIRRQADQMHQKGRTQGGDPAYTLRMAHYITAINGEEKNIGDLLRYVESLQGQDSLAFRHAIENVGIGVDLLITTYCTYPNCGWPNELMLPFGPEFFRPKRSRTGSDISATGVVNT